MTLPLTPDALASAYEYLRSTAPFRRWKLPEADEIGFRVTAHEDRFGHFYDGGTQGHWPHIAVSTIHTKDTPTLLAVIAHEMCHMRLMQLGGDWADHGTRFKRLARSVCRIHGFDPKAF